MSEEEPKRNYLLDIKIPLMDVTETEVKTLGKVVMMLLQSALKEFGKEKWIDIKMKCRALSELEYQLMLMEALTHDNNR
jgi:hypothetical protein